MPSAMSNSPGRDLNPRPLPGQVRLPDCATWRTGLLQTPKIENCSAVSVERRELVTRPVVSVDHSGGETRTRDFQRMKLVDYQLPYPAALGPAPGPNKSAGGPIPRQIRCDETSRNDSSAAKTTRPHIT